MGPYELAAFYLLMPMLAGFVWVGRHFDTIGVVDPEFEAWCLESQHIVFALHVEKGTAADVLAKLTTAFGGRTVWMEHHRGREPWTRYLFLLELEVVPDRDAVVGRIKQGALRRDSVRRPELGAMLDHFVAKSGSPIRDIWIHAELHEDDDKPGLDRRDRGWLKTLDRTTHDGVAMVRGLPDWVTSAMPRSHPYRKIG